jgi:hypothetical protein
MRRHYTVTISMDTSFGHDLDGIQRLNLMDFLLERSV